MKKYFLKKHLFPVIAALSILFSAGCAGHQTGYTGYTGYTDATDTKWIVEDIDGRGITDFAHLWMRLDSDRKIYGSGGCNSFRGHYSYTNGIFKTGPLAMTRKACPRALSRQESNFMEALSNVNSMKTVNGLLYMKGGGSTIRFSEGR